MGLIQHDVVGKTEVGRTHWWGQRFLDGRRNLFRNGVCILDFRRIRRHRRHKPNIIHCLMRSLVQLSLRDIASQTQHWVTLGSGCNQWRAIVGSPRSRGANTQARALGQPANRGRDEPCILFVPTNHQLN